MFQKLHKASTVILLSVIMAFPAYAQVEGTEEPLPAPVEEPVLVDAHYSRAFVVFLAIWAYCGVLWLTWRRSSAMGIFIASIPIFAYSVMGTWYAVLGENAPIASFILPFLSACNILYFVFARIQATAEGGHLDDTHFPDAD